MSLLLYPIYLFTFWYMEAPIGILKFYGKLNRYFLEMLSVQLLITTFFKPAKMEYREGLVAVSIALGMLSKAVFLLADVVILGFVAAFQILFLAFFLAYPVIAVYVLLI